MGGPFSLRCLSPLCSATAGVGIYSIPAGWDVTVRPDFFRKTKGQREIKSTLAFSASHEAHRRMAVLGSPTNRKSCQTGEPRGPPPIFRVPCVPCITCAARIASISSIAGVASVSSVAAIAGISAIPCAAAVAGIAAVGADRPHVEDHVSGNGAVIVHRHRLGRGIDHLMAEAAAIIAVGWITRDPWDGKPKRPCC